MRVQFWWQLLLALTVIALAGSGCSGKKDNLDPGLGPDPQPGTSGPFEILVRPQPPQAAPWESSGSLDAPGHLLSGVSTERGASFAPGDLLKDGSGHDPLLPNNGVTVNGSSLDFAPNWTGNGPLTDIAYATYRFSLVDYDTSGEDQTIRFDWAGLGPNYNEVWVGLGNIAGNSWDWFQLDDEVLTIESYTPYTAPNGTVLICVLLLSEADQTLDSLEVGAPEIRGTGYDFIVGSEPQDAAAPEIATPTFPGSFDLKGGMPPIRNQGEVGSCACFATRTIFAYELNKVWGQYGWDYGHTDKELSTRYPYALKSVGCPTLGCNLSVVTSFFQTDGDAPEFLVPYGNGDKAGFDCGTTFTAEVDNWDTFLRPEEVRSVDLTVVNDVKAVLKDGHPIAFGMLIDNWFMVYQFGPWEYTGSSEGGHAMVICGWDDSKAGGGSYLVCNSWGTFWGEDGYCWIDYDEFKANDHLVETNGYYFIEELNLPFAQKFGLGVPTLFPPTNVNASDGTLTDKVTVTWDNVSGADTYEVYRDDKATKIADVPQAANPSYDDVPPDNLQHFYWVKAVGGSFTTDFSSSDLGFMSTDPNAYSVAPTSGQRGTVAKLTVQVSTSEAVTYDWQFGTACIPSTSTDASPSVAFDQVGTHNCTVTVTNSHGSDTHNFTIVVDNALSVWTRSWGGAQNDTSADVFVDGANNVYTVGTSTSFGNGDQVVFTRITPGGVLSLSKQWGTASNESGRGICADSTGNIFICGQLSGADLFVMKLDSAGTMQQIKTLGSLGFDAANDICVDADGNVYITGQWQNGDVIVAKYDNTLNLLWGKSWPASGSEAGQSIALSPDGSKVYVAGDTDSTGAGLDELLLLAYTSAGTKLWAHTWGTGQREFGGQLAVGANGNIYACTTINEGNDSSRMALVAYNDAGTKLWQRDFAGSGLGGENRTYARGVGVDQANNVYLAGQYRADGTNYYHVLRKYDEFGNVAFTRQRQDVADHNLFGRVMCSPDGKLVICGTTDLGNWIQFTDLATGTGSDVPGGVDGTNGISDSSHGGTASQDATPTADASGTFKTGGGLKDQLTILYNPNTNDPTGV